MATTVSFTASMRTRKSNSSSNYKASAASQEFYSKTCTISLNGPGSVVPTISSVNYSEAVAGIAAQFAGYVQNKSKLTASVTASGAQGSTITAYRTTLNGTAYNTASFTTNLLSVAGNSTLSITVTDSRGRTATTTRTIAVLAYAQPTLSLFKAERCNSTGTAPQTDGNRVRISATAGASSVNAKNTMSYTVCTIRNPVKWPVNGLFSSFQSSC